MARKGIEIRGTSKLSKKLRRNATLRDIREIVRMNTIEMNQKAIRNAPVETGFLKRGITITFYNSGLSGKSKATAEYAGYVEYGTRFMNGRFYMQRAYDSQKRAFKRDLKRLVK